MIEKLKTIDPYDETEIDMDTNSVGGLVYENTPLVQKINELVDVVNELQESQNTYWTDIAELKKELQTRAENVQPDAESRPVNVHAVCPAVKYMGKVCRFWNGGNGKKFKNIGVLIEILSADNKRRYTCASKPKKHFEFCEPVKPDDDIIYKGE